MSPSTLALAAGGAFLCLGRAKKRPRASQRLARCNNAAPNIYGGVRRSCMARLIGGFPASSRQGSRGQAGAAIARIDPLRQQSHNRGGKFSRNRAERGLGKVGDFPHAQRPDSTGTANRTPRCAAGAVRRGGARPLGCRCAGAGLGPGRRWSQPEPRRIERDPVYGRPGGPDAARPGRRPASRRPAGAAASRQGQRRATASAASNLCLQLEQRLVAETQGSAQGREQLPKIENDMRNIERSYQQRAEQLNRSDCYDKFLFSKTLRRTPALHAARQRSENTRQRLADLDAQRSQIMGTRRRAPSRTTSSASWRATTAARSTQQEARRRDAATQPVLLAVGRGERGPRGSGNQFGNLPFATYRTLCVRLCDGYYFPVSFSTLPNHFQRDSELCQSQCAAPAELSTTRTPAERSSRWCRSTASSPIPA